MNVKVKIIKNSSAKTISCTIVETVSFVLYSLQYDTKPRSGTVYCRVPVHIFSELSRLKVKSMHIKSGIEPSVLCVPDKLVYKVTWPLCCQRRICTWPNKGLCIKATYIGLNIAVVTTIVGAVVSGQQLIKMVVVRQLCCVS